VRRLHDPAPWIAFVLLLGAVLFPALLLGRVVAPDVTLKNVPPWRVQWGPTPLPPARALAAATELGPRLHVIARDRFAAAVWNPWIGGGRPGWLASAREGGTPLVVTAAMLAAPGRAWTALVALQLALAFAGTVLVLRRLGVTGWPAATGAVAYALSGAAASHWLDWQGSAMALGPFVLLPALGAGSTWRRRCAAWAAALAGLLACGPPALPFIAFAAALALVGDRRLRPRATVGSVALAVLLALAVLAPRVALERHAGEPDAPPVSVTLPGPAAPLAAALVPTPPEPADPSGASPAVDASAAAFLGLPTLLLAAVGCWRSSARTRGVLLAVAGVSLLACLATEDVLARLAIAVRPFGPLALAIALLAGLGAAAITKQVPRPAAPVVGMLLAAALLVRLLPPAVAALPFGAAAEARPTAALPAEVGADGGRVLALLDAFPPDVGAGLGLADVRASSLAGEPRYRALLGIRDGVALTASRALDPRMARLGARWLLEPLPLRIVSGALFAAIEAGEAHRRPSLLEGTAVYEILAPDRVTRVGLPAEFGRPAQLVVATADRTERLLPDPALAEETERWWWFALPPGWPGGPTTIEIARGDADWPERLPLVADRSGVRLFGEASGVRVWRSERASAPAFLAAGTDPETAALPIDPRVVGLPTAVASDGAAPRTGSGRVTLGRVDPAALDVEVEVAAPALLVLQVKHRPGLWRLSVDAEPVDAVRVDGVWTGVALAPGRHLVRARARLPLGAWLLAATALFVIPALGAGRRGR